MEKFNKLIKLAVKERSSDIHLTGGHPIAYRKNGTIHLNSELVWANREIDSLVRKLLNDTQLMALRNRQSVDFAISVCNTRARINVFNTTRGLSLAIRILPGVIPTIDKLNLHPSLHQISQLESGLVLICGATGVGKTTTIAAIIDEINSNRSAHIIMLENPIEYRFQSKRCYIQQRELGTHMPSFEQGLLDVLREDPDIIVVGELREPEAMRRTLNAAEAGHLVIASLHATNAEEAIYRLLNSFSVESQEAIRFQIASTLSWLIVQNLVHLKNVESRVPLLSVCRGSSSVKSLIRDNKMHQLENAIQTGKDEGMLSASRYKEWLDSRKTFVSAAEVFVPSSEATKDIIYKSRIFDEAELVTAAAPAKKPIIIQGGGADDDEHFLTIDEEYSIQELVSELEKDGSR
ncbi:MAG: PilT/PilU family type 4a pilus ATPase [Syntrophaceae bacterium]